MLILNRTSGFVRRSITLSAALSVVLGAGVAVMNAQTSETSTSAGTRIAASTAGIFAPTLNLKFVSDDPIADTISSSSSENGSSDVATVNADPLHLNAMQYGGRQRYGQPRYRGGNTNADGSSKYIFLAGVGFTAPVGNDSNYLTTSYGFQVGGGRQFSKHFSVPIQFDWDNFGLTGTTINNQSSLYFGDPTNSNDLGGGSHIWSFTLNPTYNIYSGDGLGAYVVVGGGFYHKAASFFVPEIVEECYYYCEDYQANATIQNYSSNSAGVNGGIGLTYKFSHFSSERLYGEVRVVHTFNNYRPGITVNSTPTEQADYTGWNYFPQNSQETTYFPVKFGIRF